MIVHKPHEVASRLAQYGLPGVEILREAVVAGELRRVSCTPLDAPTIPGVSAWGESVRRLRELLVPFGWRPLNVNNVALVVDPVRKVGIDVTAGSDGVGKADRHPTNKRDKGPVTRGLVMTNKGQLSMFSEFRRFAPTPKRSEIATWLLLIFTEYKPRSEEEGDHVAYCEVSLPSEMDEDGYITQWAERIILPPVKIDEMPVMAQDDDEEDDLDIPVARL